ncbi:polyadenylate-binding protein 1-B-binding protein [Rhynchospora pubera]|uniref:Polyadenylate-binding protein 1-B-binding protein n=1 Tax=Rhynchospora pubera TaxID=906938 RepID=A0AAV8DVC5_9POAL|nr:polyadenylate-binding protein 1-B-binding protein [Rhynchospora pubera]
MATSPSFPSQFDLLRGVIHTTNLILSSHTRHFLCLAILFLLPFSSLLLTLPSIPLPSAPNSLLRSPLSPPPLPYPVYLVLFPLLLLSLTSISLSVNHGFFGRPVKLVSTLVALPLPFLRLLLTFLSSLLLLSALLTLIASLLFLFLRLHTPLLLIYLSFGTVTTISLVYLVTNWSLSGPISVLEPSTGFVPLTRSAYLIKGMHLAALSLLIFFAMAISMIIWGFNVGPANSREVFRMVAKMVLGSGMVVVMLLYWSVANVVMYMYCKGLHGELAGEIAEEFASEYVRLPFDDNKVPYVVSVIRE